MFFVGIVWNFVKWFVIRIVVGFVIKVVEKEFLLRIVNCSSCVYERE